MRIIKRVAVTIVTTMILGGALVTGEISASVSAYAQSAPTQSAVSRPAVSQGALPSPLPSTAQPSPGKLPQSPQDATMLSSINRYFGQNPLGHPLKSPSPTKTAPFPHPPLSAPIHNGNTTVPPWLLLLALLSVALALGWVAVRRIGWRRIGLTFMSIMMLSGSMFGVLAALSPATASASGTTWNWHQGNVEPASNYGWDTVSCFTTSECMAVGFYNNETYSSQTNNNGQTWSIPVQIAPFGIAYLQVSCVSATFCEVTGGSSSGDVAFSWNGSAWTGQALPSYTYGLNLDGVSCISATFCMAVGNTFNSSSYPISVALLWNGTSWTDQSPSTNAGALDGVSCVSTTFCMAVGDYPTSTAISWSGPSSGWTSQGFPANTASPYSVSCASTTFCMAVGESSSNTGVAFSWNGSTWSSQDQGIPLDANEIKSVSCGSITFCMALGYSSSSDIVLSWNGTNWTSQTTPSSVPNLDGVSCFSTTLCVIGDNTPNSSDVAIYTADEGTLWEVGTIQQPVITWQGVSCVSTTFCMAVGTANGGNEAFFTQSNDGGQIWTYPVSLSGVSDLYGVSCVSTTFCMAVGDYFGTNVALLWNGTNWTSQNQGVPSNVSIILGVSCVSASFCEAVAETNSYNAIALLWNGTSSGWTSQSIPSGSYDLYGISCASTTFCMATGNSGNNDAVLLWNGPSSGWTSQNIPSSASAVLFGVSCASTTFCVAVGGIFPSGPAVTLSWNGSQWTSPTIPTGVTSLSGVSCVSTTFCMAVGLDGSGDGVALSWDGTSPDWIIQSSTSSMYPLGGVSCPTSSYCVAAGEGGLYYGTASTPAASGVCPAGTTLIIDTFFNAEYAQPGTLYMGGHLGLWAEFGCMSLPGTTTPTITPLTGVPVTWTMPTSGQSGMFVSGSGAPQSSSGTSSVLCSSSSCSPLAIAQSSPFAADPTDTSPGSFTISATYEYGGRLYPLSYDMYVGSNSAVCNLSGVEFGQSAALSTSFGVGIEGISQCGSSSFITATTPTVAPLSGTSASGSFTPEATPPVPSGSGALESAWKVTANNSPGTWTAVISAAGVGSVSGPMTNTGTPVSTCPTSTYILRPHMNVTPNKYPLSPASFSGTVVEENMAGNQVAYGTDLQGNVMVSVNISTASGLEQIGSVQANPNQSWSLPVPSGLPPSPPGGWQVSATASACGAMSGFSHTQSVSVKPFPTAVYVVPNNNVTGGDTLADPQTVQLRVAQSRCGCVPISYEGTPIAGNTLQTVATLMKTTYGGSPWTESGTRTLGNIAVGMASNSGVTAMNTQAGSSFHLGVTKGGRPAWSQQGTMHPIPNRQQSCQINQQLNTNCTTSMSPSIGPAGTVVTILGYHLSQGNYTNVQFDGINASTYSVFTSPDGMDTIVATVPKLPPFLLRSTRSTSGYIMVPVDISYGAKDTTTTSVGEFQYEYGNTFPRLPVSNPVNNTPAPIQAACAPEAQVLQLASTPNSIAQGSVAVGICYTPNTNVNWFDPVQAATFAASGTSSVLEVPTATALSASTNPIATNQSEMVTATITDAQNGNSVSTGTVSFTTSSGATLCAEVSVSSSGTATCTISPVNSSYTVTATYNPPTGSVFEASTNNINITVAPLTCPQNQTMTIASSGSGQIAPIDQSWPSYSATSQFAHRLSITIDCVSSTGTTTPVSGVPINFDLSSSGPGGAFAEGTSNAGSQQTVDTNSSGTATSLYFFANDTLGTWNATANYGNTQSLVAYQEENSSSISGGVCGASTLNIETEVSGYAQIAANNHAFTYPLDVAAWCHSSSGTNSIPTSLSGKSVTFGPANGIAFGTSPSMTASLTSSVPTDWQNAPPHALYAQSSQFSADLSSLSTPEVVTFLPVTFPAPAGITDGPEYITAPIASTTTVSCPSSSIYSQNVTCTVSVSSTGSPTGTVAISYPSFGGTINNPTLPAQSDTQTVTLVNGQATFTMNNLQTGTDSITASYSGNSQVAPSQGSTTVTVHRDEVTLSLAALPQTALQGQVVTLTASGTLVPYIESVGQVTFTQGSQTLCSVVPINVTSNGQFSATCKVNSSSLALGTDTVTANYTDPSTSQVPSIYSSATASTTVNTEPLTCPAGQVLAVTADGSGQTASPDAQFPAVSPASLFPQPLSIQVGCVSVTTGNLVTPIAGLSVSFTLPSSGPSGGFVSLNTASGTSFSGVTNDQGIIQTPQILANSTVGSWNAIANVLGSNISFSMTNTSSVSVCPDGIQTVFMGAGQTTRNGQPFAQPLSVAIRCGATVNSSGQVVYSDPSSFTNMLNGHSVSFGSSTPPGLVFGSSSGASTASVPLTSTASTSPLYTSSVYAISPTMYADTSSSEYITTLTLPISVPPPASSATQMPEYIQGLAPTSIVLVCTPEVATYGTQIICTVTITANGQPVTTGTVTLTGPSGVTITCSPLNAAGQATCSVSGLPVGTNTLTATYSGDSSGNASSSVSISVVVQKVPVQLQACPNQTIYYGQGASCLIKVVTTKGIAVTAGDVQLSFVSATRPNKIVVENSEGNPITIKTTQTSSGTWNVSFNVVLNSNGEAVATIQGLPVGVTSLSIQYMGSNDYQAS